MKRRFTALFLALVMLFAAQLSSCSREDPVTPPNTGEEDGGVPDVKNELVDASLSDVIELLRDAVAGGAGLDSLTKGVRVSGSLPSNKTLNIPESSLYLDEGILTLASSESVSYFGLKNGAIIEISDGMEKDPVADLGILSDTDGMLRVLEYAIEISEKYLDLDRITEDDIVEGDDGLFYLSESYIRKAVFGVYVAVGLIAEGYGDDVASVPDQIMTELKADATAFADATSLKLGFGMKMRRISSVKIDLDSDGIETLADGTIKAIRLDATVKFNTSRDAISELKLDCNLTGKEFGTIVLSAETNVTYSSTGSPLVIDAKLVMAAERVNIAEKTVSSGETVTVKGGIGLTVEFGFNSRFTVTGGSLFDASLVSSASPTELSAEDLSAVTASEREELLDKKQYDRSITVSLKKNEKGEGVLPVSIKDGPLSASFSGRFEYGTAAIKYDVPDEIKQKFEQ